MPGSVLVQHIALRGKAEIMFPPTLVKPDFKDVMEAKRLSPDPNHSPAIQEQDANDNEVEHCFRSYFKSTLNPPEDPDSDGLSRNSNKQNISQREYIVFDNLILQRGDDCDGRVQGIAQKEVACSQVNACDSSIDRDEKTHQLSKSRTVSNSKFLMSRSTAARIPPLRYFCQVVDSVLVVVSR